MTPELVIAIGYAVLLASFGIAIVLIILAEIKGWW